MHQHPFAHTAFTDARPHHFTQTVLKILALAISVQQKSSLHGGAVSGLAVLMNLHRGAGSEGKDMFCTHYACSNCWDCSCSGILSSRSASLCVVFHKTIVGESGQHQQAHLGEYFCSSLVADVSHAGAGCERDYLDLTSVGLAPCLCLHCGLPEVLPEFYPDRSFHNNAMSDDSHHPRLSRVLLRTVDCRCNQALGCISDLRRVQTVKTDPQHCSS